MRAAAPGSARADEGRCSLFGVFSFQVYFYWFTYEDDIRALRALIFVLW